MPNKIVKDIRLPATAAKADLEHTVKGPVSGGAPFRGYLHVRVDDAEVNKELAKHGLGPADGWEQPASQTTYKRYDHPFTIPEVVGYTKGPMGLETWYQPEGNVDHHTMEVPLGFGYTDQDPVVTPSVLLNTPEGTVRGWLVREGAEGIRPGESTVDKQ